MASAPEDPRAAALASDLDKISKDLDQREKEILGRLRAPLDNRNPTQDLANRLREHEVIHDCNNSLFHQLIHALNV